MPIDAPGRPAVKAAARSSRGAVRRLLWSERAAMGVLLALVFLAVIAFGASEISTACLFSGIYAAFLVGLLTTCGWARRDLARLRGVKIQTSLFLLLLLAVLWPLGPWGPGGAHPVWSYVPGSLGALTVDRSALLLNVAQLLGLACLFAAARVIGASEARGRWLLRGAVLTIGVYAALAFLDHVGLRRSQRLVATLLSPNSAATVFGGGLLLTVAALINRVRRQRGLVMLRRGDLQAVAFLASAGVLATALLLTASRAGLAATLVGLGLLLVWEAIAQRQRLRVVAGLGAVALVLAIGALSLRSTELVAERLGNTEQDLSVRAAIFAPHWEAFETSPWFGFGLGSFPTVNQLVATQDNLRVLFDIRAVHNLYLQWLEEGGVIGAGLMALLFATLIWPILRGGLREGAIATWARATACAAVVFLLHGVTDFALQAPAIQALAALILGVVGSMAIGTAPRQADNRLSWGAGLAAGGVLLASLLLAAPLLASRFGGDLTAWPTAPAEALARRIETGLAHARPDAAELTRLDRLSAREVAMRPASGAAWLRRAAVDAALGRREASSLALEHSFAVAPLQTSLFSGRTLFAYNHWDQVTQSARDSAIYQLGTEWRRRRSPRTFIAMANAVNNPAGRVGMALQIAVLRMEPPPAP
ncbi:MAG: O-antigen ligase family protein [Alphaproteobacteria bacterium]|nr:O-antigen ligase family protein [Alphaproteobacteria bacterium]